MFCCQCDRHIEKSQLLKRLVVFACQQQLFVHVLTDFAVIRDTTVQFRVHHFPDRATYTDRVYNVGQSFPLNFVVVSAAENYYNTTARKVLGS